ncbi:MAG: hypothetical protein HOQ20_16325 [Bradyrhizobium sp.]|nr:hypothetical protein [Bradyrhizobium sp.]
MFLLDALLIPAMLFFLFLPITDRRTVRMRLCMLCALLAVFSLSVTRTHVAHGVLAAPWARGHQKAATLRLQRRRTPGSARLR